jgi:hypothetical protein
MTCRPVVADRHQQPGPHRRPGTTGNAATGTSCSNRTATAASIQRHGARQLRQAFPAAVKARGGTLTTAETRHMLATACGVGPELSLFFHDLLRICTHSSCICTWLSLG